MSSAFKFLEDFKEREQSNLDQAIGQRKFIEDRIDIVEKKIDDIDKKIVLYSNVVLLLQKTATYARTQAKAQVEDMVTKCLQYVFEKDIEFVIDFQELRNNPSAEFYISSIFDEEKILTDPQSAHGGGVVDVLSLALRTAFLELQDPPFEGPLILDEPGKHVSSDYIFNLGEFIQQSTISFGRQVIMVTHNNHLAQMGDCTYLVDIRNGKSIVKLKEEDQAEARSTLTNMVNE